MTLPQDTSLPESLEHLVRCRIRTHLGCHEPCCLSCSWLLPPQVHVVVTNAVVQDLPELRAEAGHVSVLQVTTPLRARCALVHLKLRHQGGEQSHAARAVDSLACTTDVLVMQHTRPMPPGGGRQSLPCRHLEPALLVNLILQRRGEHDMQRAGSAERPGRGRVLRGSGFGSADSRGLLYLGIQRHQPRRHWLRRARPRRPGSASSRAEACFARV